MGAFQRFESRLEQAVSGAFARAFRSNVQPVELAAALQRELDNSAQILSRRRRLAPNTFHLELSAGDYDRLAPYGSTLADELTTMLQVHAADEGYVLSGPVSIDFSLAEDLSTGRFRVRSAAAAEVSASPPVRRRPPRGHTSVVIEANDATYPLDPPGIVIGRGTDADLRINDPGVSRRHAEIRVVPGDPLPRVSIVDLGSTNGVQVNGRRTEHAALEDGAVVEIGNTTLRVRHIANSASDYRDHNADRDYGDHPDDHGDPAAMWQRGGGRPGEPHV